MMSRLWYWLRLHLARRAPAMRRVTVNCGDSWVDVPEGLLGVKYGQWFRTYRPDGGIYVEAQADEDGHYGLDSDGCRCGEVRFSLDTVRIGDGVLPSIWEKK
jgi:hypothetical protein